MTDQQPTTLDEAGLRALVITMADRLTNESPDDLMAEAHRLDLARELAGRDTDLRAALLARSAFLAPDATRGEYAALLRQDDAVRRSVDAQFPVVAAFLAEPGDQRMSEQQTPTDDATRALLILMADRLAAEEPHEPMTEAARLRLAHQLTEGEDPQHSALLARTVFDAPDASRADYAQLLRTEADGLDLVARYAAANARVREIGERVGRHYEENGEWRLAECEAEQLFTQAREAGHSVAELTAASLATREATS